MAVAGHGKVSLGFLFLCRRRKTANLIDNIIYVTAETVSLGYHWHATVKGPVGCRRKLQSGAIGYLEIVIDFSIHLRLFQPMDAHHVGQWHVMRLRFFRTFHGLC